MTATPDRCAKCGCRLTAETTASTYTARGITLAWCRSCTRSNQQPELELPASAPQRVFVGSRKKVVFDLLSLRKGLAKGIYRS